MVLITWLIEQWHEDSGWERCVAWRQEAILSRAFVPLWNKKKKKNIGFNL